MLIGPAGDQQRGALPDGDVPHPLHQQAEAVLHRRHEGQVRQAPQQPAQRPRDAQAAQIGDGIPATDHRHAAEIQPAERRLRAALNPGQDVARHPLAHLHRRAGHAGQGLAIGGVAVRAEIAHHPDLRMARDREIRFHHHPAATVSRAARALRQQLAQVGGPHAGGPTDRGRLDHPGLRFGALRPLEADRHLAVLDGLHPAAEHQLDATAAQKALGRRREARMHGPQDPVARIHEHDAAVGRIHLAEVAAEALLGEIAERAGQLAARGAAADHHHRLQEAAALTVRRLLGLLDRRQQAAADLIGVLEDLHRRRLGAPVLMAEVTAARSGGQDQVVVAIAPVVEHQLAVGGIEIDDLAQQHLHIGGLLQQPPQRRGHVRLRHQPGGDLIEQRLKQIEVALVDQGHPHGLSGQGSGGLDAGKPSSDDHHMGPGGHRLHRWREFEKEALPSHEGRSKGMDVPYPEASIRAVGCCRIGRRQLRLRSGTGG